MLQQTHLGGKIRHFNQLSRISTSQNDVGHLWLLILRKVMTLLKVDIAIPQGDVDLSSRTMVPFIKDQFLSLFPCRQRQQCHGRDPAFPR